MNRLPFPGRAAAAALCAAGALSAAPALAECRNVNGHYSERVLPAPGCTSPVGVCLQGTYSGSLRGDFVTVVDTFVPIAEMPPTSVAQFTAGSSLRVRIGNREGVLSVRNAGAVRTTGVGEIVDIQTIVDGTDGLAGATGVLTAFGTFTFSGGGRSEFGGVVCLPAGF